MWRFTRCRPSMQSIGDRRSTEFAPLDPACLPVVRPAASAADAGTEGAGSALARVARGRAPAGGRGKGQWRQRNGDLPQCLAAHTQNVRHSMGIHHRLYCCLSAQASHPPHL